jgi:hypothetical protein
MSNNALSVNYAPMAGRSIFELYEDLVDRMEVEAFIKKRK